MKIAVLGTRGFPLIPGGVETHCQELYSRLVERGCEVIIFARDSYAGKHAYSYKGVRLLPIFAPRFKSFEAIIHTFLGVLAAKKIDPDILHIHTIGPALLVPFAKMLGLKVVITHHGADYQRDKWGTFAKIILRFGEYVGVKFSDRIIVISNEIYRHLSSKYGDKNYTIIYNGCPDIKMVDDAPDYLGLIGLSAGKYILAFGRFVEEKGFHDLIDAYNLVKKEISFPLVIAGDADHESNYSRALKNKALISGVILTGYLTGSRLSELTKHAKLFVIPSYHEGLPIALLEAIAYGLNIVASNIDSNMEVSLPEDCYYEVGNVNALAKKLVERLSLKFSENYDDIYEKYNWNLAADETLRVYRELIVE